MNKLLYNIIAEIFDIYPNDEFINKFIINNDINIDIILSNSFLKINIIYNILWNFIYKTFPTKKDFIDFINENSYDHNSFIEINNNIFDKIINNFFHLKIGGINLLEGISEFDKIKTNILENINKTSFITQTIYNKLLYRYNIDFNNHNESDNIIITIANIMELYTPLDDIYKIIYKNNYIYNPLSNNIHEYLSFSDDDIEYLNEYELLQYIIYKDNHFIIKFIDNISVLIENETNQIPENYMKNIINLYHTVHNKKIILINYPYDKINIDSSDKLPINIEYFNISENIYRLLPNLCKYHLTISNNTYPVNKALSFKKTNAIYNIYNFTENNKNNIKILQYFDRYIINKNNIGNNTDINISTKLEKYTIYNKDISTNNFLILHFNIINNQLYDEIWKLHIKNICPFNNNDVKSGMILYCDFLYNYYIKNINKIHDITVSKLNNKINKYCLVLIDNRENIFSVISVLFSMINLNNDWDCKIITSKKSMNYYKKYLPFADIINNEYLDNLIFTIDIYNIILKSISFWDQLINYDRCLIVQDDGILLRNGIDRYIHYDYIGSPWFDGPGNEYLKLHCECIANGGFSLRNPKKMKKICENYQDEKNILFFNNLNVIAEDVYFSKFIRKIDSKLPPNVNEASGFASEQLLNLNSLGIHKLWLYNSPHNTKMYFNKLLE